MEEIIRKKVERQNILNNSVAMKEAENQLNFEGNFFNGVIYYTNEQLANIFGVTLRTIERTIENNREELNDNGYQVLSGKRINSFRNEAIFATDISVGHQVRNLGVSTFRTLLNFAMLLSDSDNAKFIRSKTLDIVLNTLAEKTGGSQKYINRRDKDYLPQALTESKARDDFTEAIKSYVEDNKFKYANLTNYVYKAIFKENASQYKKILKLSNSDSVRSTMYAEVLLLIASFEKGLAYEIKKTAEKKGRKITVTEAGELIQHFGKHPLQEPLLANARIKMASRDLGFRDAYHKELEEYIQPITEEDFEKFLGEQSIALEEQMDEFKEVFLRLKDK